MRTTLNLNDNLLTRAKRRAADERRTLTAVVEEALRRLLDNQRTKVRKVPEIPVFHGGRQLPGIDFTDHESIQDMLDEEEFGIPRR